MWAQKRHHYVSPNSSLTESFHSDTLQGLLLNEQTANQYYGKRMRVYVTNGPTLQGELSYCSTDSNITFKNPTFESIAPNWVPSLAMEFAAPYKSIHDMILIEHDTDVIYREYRPLKSVIYSILDLVKLKMVENILRKLTKSSCSSVFEPLDIKHRKLYHKSSTPHSKKVEIGDNILNMKIPTDPMTEQYLSTALDECNRSDIDTCLYNHNNTLNKQQYSWYDALSLIHHYHQLWIQQINDDSKQRQHTPSSANAQKRQSYIEWDESQMDSDTVVSSLLPDSIYPSIEKELNSDEAKPKDVYLKSFWPFYFHGPCTKSIKKNSDWKCMKCNMESTQDDEIKYYKAKRTDATMEICTRCVPPPSAPTIKQKRAIETPKRPIRHRMQMPRRVITPASASIPSYTQPKPLKYCICGKLMNRFYGATAFVVCSRCYTHILSGFVCNNQQCLVRFTCEICGNGSVPMAVPLSAGFVPNQIPMWPPVTPMLPTYTQPVLPYTFGANPAYPVYPPAPIMNMNVNMNMCTGMSQWKPMPRVDTKSNGLSELELNSNAALRIRNLPTNVTKDTLSNLFSPLAKYICKVQILHAPNLSTVTGFVLYNEEEVARRAQSALDGLNVSGHKIEVTIASDK